MGRAPLRPPAYRPPLPQPYEAANARRSAPPRPRPFPQRTQDLPKRRTPPVVPAPLPAPRADAAADASAVAAAFGVDFLSWDESDPGRRGRALIPYTTTTAEEQLAGVGWSRRGRQRAELALPGTVVPLTPHRNRLLVHVRVRVTPFRRLTAGTASREWDTTDVLPFPAAAPAPADPAWVPLESYWYELLIPVYEVQQRWRVDLHELIVMPPLVPTLDLAGHRSGGGDR